MSTQADARTPRSGEALTVTGQLAAAELRKGDVLAGRFRVENMLGVGGMGVVYRAHDLSLGVDVALKLLRPELARRPEAFERFRQELLLARQVSSPHVVRIHDIAQQDGRWFISMDFVDGDSLERRMDMGGKMAPADALPIARGLLEGLSAAHQRGVVHRDLKPANVLLDQAGQAYITDFGVARSLGATGGMTQSGVIFGTPEYLSPEQARGEVVDGRSDLYAVGLIVYEMFSGTLPFSGGTPAETVMQRIVRQPPSLAQARPDLPHWTHAFCDRLLKLNPAHRFASAREALQALDTQRVPRPPLNRTRLLLILLVAVAVLGGAQLVRRYVADAVPPSAPVALRIARVAILPIGADAADAQMLAVARAVDEHLRNWLRNDATLAVVPRARTLAALARTVPDANQGDAAMLRQLPDIARAASANWIVHARLRRDGQQMVLDLGLDDSSAQGAEHTLSVRGADAAALFAAYASAVPEWIKPLAAPGPAPALAAAALPAFGNGLLAADRGDADAAAKEFAQIVGEAPSALLAHATLTAQDAAGEDLPAQTTRAAIAAQLSKEPSALARETVALALADGDQSDAALRTLSAAQRAYPNDAALALLEAQMRSDSSDDAGAIAALQRVVKLDDQNARAWFMLGRSAIQQGESQQAVDDYLVRALVLNTRAGDEAAVAETANAMGIGYERLGQLDAATEQYTRAAALREKLGDKPGLAKSLRNLAIVQAQHGDHAAAEHTLDRVKKLLEGLGDRASLADLYNDRGVVAEENGDFAAALAAYRQALAIRQQLNLPGLVAESQNNVGFSAYQMGDFDNAGAYWQQALAQFKQLGDENRVLAVSQSMALLDIARGHFAAARERLDATLKSAQDHQLPEVEGIADESLAELDLIEGRLGDGAAAAARAQQIFTRRTDQRALSEALLLQARIALALGDAAQAAAVLDTLPPNLGAEQRAAALLAQARRAELAGDAAQAAEKLDAAAKTAAEAHSGSVALRIELERTRQMLALGNLAATKRQLATVRKQATQLGEVPLRLEWLQLEIALALRSGDNAGALARYRESLALLKTSGRYRDAVLLHALGRHAAGGAEAIAAQSAADAARSQLLADAPQASRESLQRVLQRHWQALMGNGDGP